MHLLPNPPTIQIRDALAELLTNGAAALGIDPQLPGIPVYRDDEPDSVVAPYILIDCTADPAIWAAGLWAQQVLIKIVQPYETPADESVSEDYDFDSAAIYEHNLECLIRGNWPIADVDYDQEDRTTFYCLSDLLHAAATAAGVDLALVDTDQLHSPATRNAGPPKRTKFEISMDNEIEFDFLLVGGIPDTSLA